jgi:putative endonuclease
MAKSHKQKTYDRGLWAENIAKIYLMLKGYRILQNRYKCPMGEIDIITKKKDTLIFVEVKSRKTKTQALESVTYKMRGRIEKAALHYCAVKKITDTSMRFDLISVIPPLYVHHLDNAWQPQA